MRPQISRADRYDAVTITFHWLTAALVLTLFGTAMAWTYLPRDLGLRWLESVHVSLGIGLAAVLIGRLVWRPTAGRKLAEPPGNRAVVLASKLVHFALYGLLIAQVALGFGIEWAGGQGLSFFGLFTLPSPFTGDRALAHQFEEIHGVVAWSLIVLAGGHAMAALWHHYGARDGVPRRMIPGRG